MKTWGGDIRAVFTASWRDKFNHFMRVLCRPIYAVTHRRVLIGEEHVDQHPGGYLVVANHTSPLDIPGLMYGCPRLIDFVSTVEVMGVPGVGAFYRMFNTITLDRGRVDAGAVRTIVSRLRAGRVVCVFPEGRLTPEEESVLNGGDFRAGFGQIARLADVPVIPTVVLDTHRSARITAWLPFKRTRFCVAFGEPLRVRDDLDNREAQKDIEERWKSAMTELAKAVEPHR